MPLACLLLLLLPGLLGATFKWRDAEGQLHLTDTPPPAGTPYELVAAPQPTQQRAAPPPSSTPPDTKRAVPNDTAGRHSKDPLDADAHDDTCVDALYQLELLEGKYKVYRPSGAGDGRVYLDDRDRPAEIARLTKVRDDHCMQGPADRGAQQRRAAVLFQALSPGCREALEKLHGMERPDSRTPDDEIERQREYLQRYCPESSAAEAKANSGIWLADWVWQWHRQ